MNLHLTTYITLICTSGVLNLYLCFYVFLKRHNYTNIANFFIIYTSSITIYCFASAFGLTTATLKQIKFWTTIEYIGMPFAPPLGLLFIMQYFGMKITKKSLMAFLIIPFISFVMVATNDFHHLFYKVYEIDPNLGVPFIHQEIGIWYMIHGAFIFGCMFVAFLLVLFRWKETAKVYRPQLIALMFGQLVPMLTAFLYLIGLTPPGIDPVPMVLWLSSLLYLWAINSSRMFSIMPIAKDAIFNSINDGVIVLDESNRLIEFNQACLSMFPQFNKSMLGMDFDTVWLKLSGESFPLKIETDALSQELQLAADQLKRDQELAEAKAESSPFSVILFDIDYFKKVNDTYGHDVGDQLLKHVAKVCQSQLKEGILFARYGGEYSLILSKRSRA